MRKTSVLPTTYHPRQRLLVRRTSVLSTYHRRLPRSHFNPGSSNGRPGPPDQCTECRLGGPSPAQAAGKRGIRPALLHRTAAGPASRRLCSQPRPLEPRPADDNFTRAPGAQGSALQWRSRLQAVPSSCDPRPPGGRPPPTVLLLAHPEGRAPVSGPQLTTQTLLPRL